jgi:hypothetical protein
MSSFLQSLRKNQDVEDGVYCNCLQCHYCMSDFYDRYLKEHEGVESRPYCPQGVAVIRAREILRNYRDTCLAYAKSQTLGKPVLPPGLSKVQNILLVYKILNELNFCVTQKLVWRKQLNDAYQAHSLLNLSNLHQNCPHCVADAIAGCQCKDCLSAAAAFWLLYSAKYIDAASNTFLNMKQLFEQTIFVPEPPSALTVLSVGGRDTQQVNERERSVDILRFALSANFCTKTVRWILCKSRTDLFAHLATPTRSASEHEMAWVELTCSK